jgi:hypothetical protein
MSDRLTHRCHSLTPKVTENAMGFLTGYTGKVRVPPLDAGHHARQLQEIHDDACHHQYRCQVLLTSVEKLGVTPEHLVPLEQARKLHLAERPVHAQGQGHKHEHRQGAGVGLGCLGSLFKAASGAKRTVAKEKLAKSAAGASATTQSMRHQGDMHAYTDSALAQRRALRKHPAVIDMLDTFWSATVRHHSTTVQHQQAVAEQTQNANAATSVRLDRESYRTLHSRLARACGLDADTPPLTDAEAAQAFEADWDSDSHGEGFVDKPKLLDSLFEMADLWVDGVHVEDYKTYLTGLHRSMFGAANSWHKLKTMSAANRGFRVSESQAEVLAVKLGASKDAAARAAAHAVTVAAAAAQAAGAAAAAAVSAAKVAAAAWAAETAKARALRRGCREGGASGADGTGNGAGNGSAGSAGGSGGGTGRGERQNSAHHRSVARQAAGSELRSGGRHPSRVSPIPTRGMRRGGLLLLWNSGNSHNRRAAADDAGQRSLPLSCSCSVTAVASWIHQARAAYQ